MHFCKLFFRFSYFISTVFALFFSVIFQIHASTANIHYQATDLADITAGEDLWQYTYTVSDYSFGMNTGFSLFFDPALYSNLQNPAPSVNADWDILVTQPEPLFIEKGGYDAVALIDAPSLNELFTLSFSWLGTEIPDTQVFAIYDTAFNSVFSGNTVLKVATVPVTPSFWLFTTGLWTLFIR